MIATLQALLGVLLKEKSAIKFAVGVLLGLGFSISVILSTVGIMDGFEYALKNGLKRSMGDLTFFSSNGFFQIDQKILGTLKSLNIQQFSSIVQTEGFVIHNENSRGVLVKGIDPREFRAVTGIDFKLEKNQVAIGKELASQLKVAKGSELVLGLASGNQETFNLPRLQRFTLAAIVDHGIYQKDLRMLYLKRSSLQTMLGIGQKVNLVALNYPSQATRPRPQGQMKRGQGNSSDQEEDTVRITKFQTKLSDYLKGDFIVRPYWREFSTLIEAVKIEKFIVGLILQLVVVISIFNVLAFIIFLNEKRARELFLFKAVGLSQNKLMKAWFAVVFLIWFFSSTLSIFFVKIFDYALGNLSFLKLPGDIYYLGRLSITLDLIDYLLVFSLTLFWLFLVSWIGLIRLKKKSILQGLRKEFA